MHPLRPVPAPAGTTNPVAVRSLDREKGKTIGLQHFRKKGEKMSNPNNPEQAALTISAEVVKRFEAFQANIERFRTEAAASEEAAKMLRTTAIRIGEVRVQDPDGQTDSQVANYTRGAQNKVKLLAEMHDRRCHSFRARANAHARMLGIE